MLAKKFRLNLRTDKSRVVASGQTYYSPLLTLIVAPQPEGSIVNSRFSVITSRKFHPLSVKRHQVKRLIYLKIRELLPHLHKSQDYLIIPKHPLLSASPEQVKTELARLLKK